MQDSDLYDDADEEVEDFLPSSVDSAASGAAALANGVPALQLSESKTANVQKKRRKRRRNAGGDVTACCDRSLYEKLQDYAPEQRRRVVHGVMLCGLLLGVAIAVAALSSKPLCYPVV